MHKLSGVPLPGGFLFDRLQARCRALLRVRLVERFKGSPAVLSVRYTATLGVIVACSHAGGTHRFTTANLFFCFLTCQPCRCTGSQCPSKLQCSAGGGGEQREEGGAPRRGHLLHPQPRARAAQAAAHHGAVRPAGHRPLAAAAPLGGRLPRALRHQRQPHHAQAEVRTGLVFSCLQYLVLLPWLLAVAGWTQNL